MKEMIYNTNFEYEVLHQGSCNNFKFYVVSYGFYPCCYIEIPPNILDDVVENCPCHGGVTYNGGVINDFPEGRYIGWDYAHFEDYHEIYHKNGKKWTTEELVEECVKVCNWLSEQLKTKSKTVTFTYEEAMKIKDAFIACLDALPDDEDFSFECEVRNLICDRISEAEGK